jgi:hypothetical protein
MLPRNYFRLCASALWVSALVCAPWAARADSLCENEEWQCAALSATVGHKSVSSIHDPTHQDRRTLDGGIADISVKVGQILTLKWVGEADKENKQKAHATFKIISNKTPPIGCREPDWGDEDALHGESDVDFAECNQGRNFVITFKVDQGKTKDVEKVARLRVHVLRKDQNTENAGDANAATTKDPELPADEEADFAKLLNY